jgi:ubiquinone/menaquinone biosynthesis C-methylase UbiE
MDEEWVRTFWDGRAEREAAREEEDVRKQVHTDLLRREIRRAIGDRAGLRILDAGAGTGRFSLPLAARGHRVTHLDLSPAMIGRARAAARASGIEGIEFVEGSVVDLSRFADGSFDVTLCLDSPLSFCHDRREDALDELTRVTRSSLVLCVMNLLGVCLEDGGLFDLTQYGRLVTLPVVHATGTLDVTEEMLRRAPTLVPSWHAFRPDELRELLERRGWRVERLTAPGTLARFTPPELLLRLTDDEEAYREYLDFAERLDADPDVRGLGAARAGGLLAVATRR